MPVKDNNIRPPLTAAIDEATRKIHKRNNAAVLPRVLAAASDFRIYRQYVRDFYFVFEAFETEWSGHVNYGTCSALAKAQMPILERTNAFERDLTFYYGPDWKKIAEEEKSQLVVDYVNYIKKLSKSDPERLLAYGYTFYLGLFAGGNVIRQILLKRANFLRISRSTCEKSVLTTTRGLDIFEFLEPALSNSNPNFSQKATSSPNNIKEEFRSRIESLAAQDPTLTPRLVNEAMEILRRNLAIIENVQGAGRVYARWAAWVLVTVLVMIATYQFYVVGLW